MFLDGLAVILFKTSLVLIGQVSGALAPASREVLQKKSLGNERNKRAFLCSMRKSPIGFLGWVKGSGFPNSKIVGELLEEA
ncbi:hypothetical protein MPNT_70041 [Candidatus Methylacidithermus pantelleriae]|uniref:Uncharacterized protein n=1 Tax=Candidatus Methylacidithermus pantelleriae TaxID=2744239 RepID=A0A8J2FTF2_9BACT|nr:hypothetical protein MPNT_70041 [Candidatus Methylacidithermus pantelleriae]